MPRGSRGEAVPRRPHTEELLAGRAARPPHAWAFILTQRVGSHGELRLLRDPLFPHRGFQPAGVLAGPLESRGLKASENLGGQVAHCRGLSTGFQGALLGPRSALDSPVCEAASRAMPPQIAVQSSSLAKFLFYETAHSKRRSGAPNISVSSGAGSVSGCTTPRGVLPAFGALTPKVQSFSDTGNGDAWDRF